MLKQQLLDLFKHEKNFNNFIGIHNESTVANLQNFSNQYTHIYGDHLSGKTHLLHAWVHLANSTVTTHRFTTQAFRSPKIAPAIYLSSKQVTYYQLSQIDLATYRFIAIDDIDQLSEDLQVELFNLFNHIKLQAQDNYLLTSSQVHLSYAQLRHDLKTRIHSGMVFALKSLTEDELLNALIIYTKQEGIKIGISEINYLLTHYTRNLGILLKLINQISYDATIYKKPITIPFIKHNLNPSYSN